MSKKCPEGKIINPATNRCVKVDGAIGKKLLATQGKSMEEMNKQKGKKLVTRIATKEKSSEEINIQFFNELIKEIETYYITKNVRNVKVEFNVQKTIVRKSHKHIISLAFALQSNPLYSKIINMTLYAQDWKDDGPVSEYESRHNIDPMFIGQTFMNFMKNKRTTSIVGNIFDGKIEVNDMCHNIRFETMKKWQKSIKS